jgi:hypothetical protein
MRDKFNRGDKPYIGAVTRMTKSGKVIVLVY